jgi:hypothetical protein
VDNDGFIWLATESGLTRFDGTRFRTYTSADGLPDNLVLKVTAAKSGGVWFSTIQNMPYLFNHDSIVKRFAPPELVSKRIGMSEEVYEDSIGNAYLGTGTDVIKATPQGAVSLLRSYVKGLPERFVFGIRKNRFLLTTPEDKTYEIVRNDCRFLFQSEPLQTLFGFTGDGKRIVYNYKAEPHVSGSLNDDTRWAIVHDTVLFISSIDGRELFRFYQKSATAAIVDPDDNIWISTEGSGVIKIPSTNIKYLANTQKKEVFSIVEYNGRLWMGFDQSTVITAKKDFSDPQKMDLSTFTANTDNPNRRAITHNRIYTFAKDSNDALYIGSDAFMQRRGDNILTKSYAPIKTMAIAGNYLLMGTDHNALLLDKMTLKRVDTLYKIRTIASEFANNRYYLGTTTGLLVLDANTGQLIKKETNPLLNKRIVSIKKDGMDNIYIATSDQGLVKYSDQQIENIRPADGLLSNICTSLFIDSKNEIWLGTDKGLNHIYFLNGKRRIEKFTEEDGLVANMVNAITVSDSTVYIGTPAGLSYFNRYLVPATSICRLYIENVYRDTAKLALNSSYNFNYNVTNIRFDYGVISYRSGNNITYQYTLQGLESDWHISNTSTLVFPSLAAGDYRLLMKAVNRYGVESNTIEISIHIASPWWKTPWFLGLASLALLLSVFLVYSNRVRKIRKQEKERRSTQYQLSQLEQQALQSQMNPHFIFNCLNSIQQYIFTDNKVAANQYLTGFASLIRQTLDNSSRKTISVSEEIDYLKKYLEMEKVRFGDNFTYNIVLDETVQADLIEIPPLLLQPYVENCLRHGLPHKKAGRGIIDINFENHDDTLWCRVKDNGVGRARASQLKSISHIEYQSKGMSLTQKRIDLLNRSNTNPITTEVLDVLDSYGQVTGTEVIVKFPINT